MDVFHSGLDVSWQRHLQHPTCVSALIHWCQWLIRACLAMLLTVMEFCQSTTALLIEYSQVSYIPSRERLSRSVLFHSSVYSANSFPEESLTLNAG